MENCHQQVTDISILDEKINKSLINTLKSNRPRLILEAHQVKFLTNQ